MTIQMNDNMILSTKNTFFLCKVLLSFIKKKINKNCDCFPKHKTEIVSLIKTVILNVTLSS